MEPALAFSPNDYVYAIAQLPDGGLIAAGRMSSVAGQQAASLARWHESAWHALGPPATAPARAIAVLRDGSYVVGGDPSVTWSQVACRITKRTGNEWISLGAATPAPDRGTACLITAILECPNRDLIVAGDFGAVSGVGARYIARWNGQEWTPLGPGPGFTFGVSALALLPDGRLVAANADDLSVDSLAAWNGSAWGAIGSPITGSVSSLAVLPNGDLVAAGSIGFAGLTGLSLVVRWNGTQWSTLAQRLTGATNDRVFDLAVLPDGGLVAAGQFDVAAGVSARNIIRWDGDAWHPLGAGVANYLRAVAALDDGSIIAGGKFTEAGGVPASNIARWDGASWAPMGAGLASAQYSGVSALAVLPNADIVAVGGFSRAGDHVSRNVAIWASPCRCPADVDDGSNTGTRDDGVTIDDLLYFLPAFAVGDTHADIDNGSATGTPDGGVTIDDLLYFLSHFDQGC